MSINQSERLEIQTTLDMSYNIYEQYHWLLDAYVSDFYVHNHWLKLPKCWRESLKDLELETIGNIIDSNQTLRVSQVLPLSLLALRQSVRYLQIPRKQQPLEMIHHTIPGTLFFDKYVGWIDRFRKLFGRRIKTKKRHEITCMSHMCYKLAVKSNCYHIVDIGSGLGHLSRRLGYGYGLKVCSLEAQEYLTKEARKLDQEVENTYEKCFNETPDKCLRPMHINMRIETTSDGKDILKAVRYAFGTESENLQFGIVGLHPCGDLGVALLRFFKTLPQVKFINIVGCCYMKLSDSTSNSPLQGYPLSQFCIQKGYNLTYSSREVACHAMEAYIEKLSSGQHSKFKIHSYRAALEKLIVEKWPEKFHSHVRSVQYFKDLSFSDYCFKAISKSDMELNVERMKSNEIQSDLENWKLVVIFYSLRLMIAPLVETIILFDRILFILESGSQCDMVSLFDPQISPRNIVLSSIK